jgi:hypothetical protein
MIAKIYMCNNEVLYIVFWIPIFTIPDPIPPPPLVRG